eukprot:IDg6672t1
MRGVVPGIVGLVGIRSVFVIALGMWGRCPVSLLHLKVGLVCYFRAVRESVPRFSGAIPLGWYSSCLLAAVLSVLF